MTTSFRKEYGHRIGATIRTPRKYRTTCAQLRGDRPDTRRPVVGGGGDNWVLGNARIKQRVNPLLITGPEQMQILPRGTRSASSLLEAGGGSIQDASLGRARLDILGVSVRAPAADVDIYTPVMNQKAAQIQTEILVQHWAEAAEAGAPWSKWRAINSRCFRKPSA